MGSLAPQRNRHIVAHRDHAPHRHKPQPGPGGKRRLQPVSAASQRLVFTACRLQRGSERTSFVPFAGPASRARQRINRFVLVLVPTFCQHLEQSDEPKWHTVYPFSDESRNHPFMYRGMHIQGGKAKSVGLGFARQVAAHNQSGACLRTDSPPISHNFAIQIKKFRPRVTY